MCYWLPRQSCHAQSVSITVDYEYILLIIRVPRIFDGCPSYLSSPQPPSRDPSSERNIYVKQRKEAEQQEWLKCDKIDSYEQFSSDVNVHLQLSFPSVFVHQSEDHVLIYKVNHSDDIISFCFCVSNHPYL